MGVIFLSSCPVAFANVVINEVRVNNGEFVELYNSGSTDVPLGNYYFAYYSSSRTNWNNPYRSQKFPDSSIIKKQSFYVIALGQYTSQFDWQPYTSNQLSDTDGTVALWSDNPTANTSQLLDAFGWGKVSLSEGQPFSLPASIPSLDSFGRIPDGLDTNNNVTDFSLTLATPGATNQLDTTSSTTTTASTTSDNTDNTDNTSVVVGGGGGVPADYSGRDSVSNSSSATSIQGTQTQTQKIKTQIVAKTLNFVGLPVAFQANSFGINGEKLYFGKYFWNFGDGDSKEMTLTDPEPFNHTYYYPGDYVVSLDYYQNAYGGDIVPDATSQIDVKIIPADISISNIGDDKDFFVEIANNTDYGADISGWILQSAQKSFVFPRDTIILSKQKMTISPKITNFSVADESTLKLVDPAGNTIFDYSTPTTTNAISSSVTDITTAMAPAKPILAEQPKESTAAYMNETIPPVKSLTASALSSNVPKNTSTRTSSPIKTTIFIVSFLFIGAAAYAVYFIRRKKFMVNDMGDSTKAGNDFEILDE